MPAPMRPRDEANVLATLSVVFAFVFAPAGAILGHLALSQIRQPVNGGGGGRVLVVVLSAEVVVGVAVRIEVVSDDGLLPSLDEVKNISGDKNLKAENPIHKLEPLDPKDGTYDRPECAVTTAVGIPDEYAVPVAGFAMTGFFDLADPRNPRGSVQGVAAIHDATEAQTQLTNLQAAWRRCGGSTTVKLTYGDTGRTVPFSIGVPADAGNGIITLDISSSTVHFVRAIAAKANVFIEVRASSTVTDRAHQAGMDVVNYILGKIPG